MTETAAVKSDDPVADFLQFWGLRPPLMKALKVFQPEIVLAVSGVDESLYKHLFDEPSIRRLISDAAIRSRVIAAMTDHWREILTVDLSRETLERSAQTGKRHSEYGVTERQFLFASQRVAEQAIHAIRRSNRARRQQERAIEAVLKLSLGHAEIVLASHRESAAALAAMIAVRRGTKALKDQVHSLEEMAYVDKLTGLFNRRYFDQALAKEIARSQRAHQPLCLIMTDLDHFKVINDSYGHAAGDMVLQELGRLLLQVARQSDVCARVGGEEFAILVPDTSSEQAKQLAERLRERLAGRIIKVSATAVVSVTLSLGIAVLEPSDAGNSLFARADQALYAAKRAGRNQTILAPGKTSSEALP